MTTPIEQDTIYALARSGASLYAARASGLYASQDQGATWQDLFASLDAAETVAATSLLAVGETLFAGVKGAVLRSDDAGQSWHIGALPSPPPLVVALAASPNYAANGILAAATAEDGVFISTDRGTSWAGWNFGLVDLNVYSLAFSAAETLFAGTESGVFYSHNGGKSWRETPFPMDAAPVLSLGCAKGLLYAGTESSGLLVSADTGVTWRKMESELISTSVNAIHTVGAEVWLLLEDKLLRSRDSGVSWQAQTVFPADRLAMALHLSAGTLTVGFADGTILVA